jgi:hypothetical protein
LRNDRKFKIEGWAFNLFIHTSTYTDAQLDLAFFSLRQILWPDEPRIAKHRQVLSASMLFLPTSSCIHNPSSVYTQIEKLYPQLRWRRCNFEALFSYFCNFDGPSRLKTDWLPFPWDSMCLFHAVPLDKELRWNQHSWGL